MNQQQFDQMYSTGPTRKLLGIRDLTDRTPRTLVYGCNVNGTTHHVYIGPDEKIHVLTYTPITRQDGVATFMIHSHTSGVSGGVQRNGDYMPNNRVYGESCDLEFCQLLKNHDVHVSYAEFSNSAEELRLAAHGGFSGFTLQHGGCVGASLHDELQSNLRNQDSLLLERYRVLVGGQLSNFNTLRLILQSTHELGVPAVKSYNSADALVDAAQAERVLIRAKQLFNALPSNQLQDEELADNLLDAVLGKHRNFRCADSVEADGKLTIIEVRGISLDIQGEVVSYDGTPNAYWKQAHVGSYRGRPFVVFVNSAGLKIGYCTFGDTTDVVEQLLAHHEMDISAKA